MRIDAIKRLLVGPPMPLAQARHERLGKAVALAVFASDPLSSVAYATEEILLVLVLAGHAALSYSLPVAIGIAALLAVVVVSYRQTVQAYPQAGGAYLVAKDNLGTFPALSAAAALLTDYVLTVAVSVVAGVAALTSAFPALFPHRVTLSILAVGAITLGNLRGVRESGRMFAAPTYFFTVSILVMVGYGLVASKLASRAGRAQPSEGPPDRISEFRSPRQRRRRSRYEDRAGSGGADVGKRAAARRAPPSRYVRGGTSATL